MFINVSCVHEKNTYLHIIEHLDEDSFVLCVGGGTYAHVCGQKLMLGVFLGCSYFLFPLRQYSRLSSNSRCSWSWPWTSDSSASISWVLKVPVCVHAWSMGWNETQGFMHIRHSASLSPSILPFEEASLTAPRPQQLARLGGQESLFSFSWQRNHGRLSLYLDLKHICVHVRICLRYRHDG